MRQNCSPVSVKVNVILTPFYRFSRSEKEAKYVRIFPSREKGVRERGQAGVEGDMRVNWGKGERY